MTSPSLKKAGSLEDLLDSALQSKPKPPEPVTTPIMSTEPPPMSDDESSEEEEAETKNRTKYVENLTCIFDKQPNQCATGYPQEYHIPVISRGEPWCSG